MTFFEYPRILDNLTHIRTIAIKDIEKGEEVTINYIINKLENPLWEFEYEVSQ